MRRPIRECVGSAHKAAGIFPQLDIRMLSSIWIFGRFSHPHAALCIPINADRLGNERLGSHETDVEVGMDLKLHRSFFRRGRSSFRIAQ